MFTVLAIGDSHFKCDNLHEMKVFVEKLEKVAKEIKPDLIVYLGDLLNDHERLHILPLNFAIAFIEKLSKIQTTLCLQGNHDGLNNSQYLSPNHWMTCLKYIPNVIVVDTVKEYIDKKTNTKLILLPYVPVGRFMEALSTSGYDWKKADCIFAHQEFKGCKMGAIVSEHGDIWDLEYPNVVSGHIHSKQSPQKNIYYTGSSVQVAFGESENNTLALLTFSKGKKDYSLEEIDLDLPRKKIVYTDIENIDDVKIPEKNKDHIKISISGGYDEFKAFKKTKKYKELTKSGTKVVFKPKKLKVANDRNDINDSVKPLENPDMSVNEVDFTKILTHLVHAEKNPYLYQVHELLLNGKEISEDEILFT